MEGTQKLVEFQTTSAKPVEDQQTDHEADVGEEEVSNEEPQHNRIYQLPSAGQGERLGNLLGLKIWWLMHFQW